MSGAGPSALRVFVDELARAGVRDAVICPGSRSTPVALALRAHDRIHVRVLIDERSAAYFALGLAKTSRRPVALLATSGTAVVNFAPAVVEASLARVPLVVLTADRPEELLDRGAPQTIDQNHLYGSHAKWFAELDLGTAEAGAVENARRVATRAVATSLAGPSGPVQVNLPLREPLIPDEQLGAIPGDHLPTSRGALTLAEAEIAALASRLATVKHGLIVAGPLDDPETHEPIARLAAATGYPILADPLSGLRSGSHDRSMVMVHADHATRSGPWIDGHRPDLVVRFGAMPTSKPVTELMARTRPELLVIDGDAGWRESALVPARFVHADAASTALALAAEVAKRQPYTESSWAADWQAADRAAENALARWLGGLTEPFEGEAFRVLSDLLPAGSCLWAGSSMPVRDMDAWLPSRAAPLRVLSNRGANGIDGVVSTALGSAAAMAAARAATPAAPVALVVGDLSFLHDLGGLVAARLTGLDLLVVLVNNDGGGIFSLLPQARTPAPGAGLPERFEELFGTPHGIDLGAIVRSFGFRHRIAEAGDLRGSIEAELGEPGLRVVEVRTERLRNVQLHDQAAVAVAAALIAVSVGGRP